MPAPASTKRAGNAAVSHPPTVSNHGETYDHQQKMPVLPKNTARRTTHGPGRPRNLNCPAKPASATPGIWGTKRQVRASDSRAQAATKPKAARQLSMPASRVPNGTPTVFASDWPSTINATAWPSRPFSAMALAAMVAVPKNAPCGRPDIKRATVNVVALGEVAAKTLPAKHSNIKSISSFLGATLWPKTRIRVPKHTPIA